jgi:hypothetical protein
VTRLVLCFFLQNRPLQSSGLHYNKMANCSPIGVGR